MPIQSDPGMNEERTLFTWIIFSSPRYSQSHMKTYNYCRIQLFFTETLNLYYNKRSVRSQPQCNLFGKLILFNTKLFVLVECFPLISNRNPISTRIALACVSVLVTNHKAA